MKGLELTREEFIKASGAAVAAYAVSTRLIPKLFRRIALPPLQVGRDLF